MPFWLYSTTVDPYGSKHYEQQEEIALAGNTNGLIYRALRAKDVREAAWVLDSAELLAHAGYDPGTGALVIEPTPAREGAVGLFAIRRIVGHSASGWTPVMLALEVLQHGDVSPGAEAASKERFDVGTSPGDRVYTFLYMRGDHDGGSWNWGAVGRVNGPLLREAAFEHFIKVSRIDASNPSKVSGG